VRVYVSVDMEGCSGVVHREHTSPKGYDYELARRYMTGEANAAVTGAFDGGATEVLISDSHGGNGYRNFLLEDLDSRVDIMFGSPRRLGQMEGLDASFDMVFLVGYHSRHGTHGTLNHSTNGQAIANVWVNEQLVGEVGINAYVAGHFGIPVTLVAGDDTAISEARELLEDFEAVVVKRSVGRYAARCVHPKRARESIAEAAARAVRNGPGKAFKASEPVEVRVQYKETGSAESAARVPGAQLVTPDTVVLSCGNMQEAYEQYSAMVELWHPAWGGWIRG